MNAYPGQVLPKAIVQVLPGSCAVPLSLISRTVFSKRFRSLMSRMALETSTPSSVSSGLRLISHWKFVPVLVQGVEFQIGPHGPDARLAKEISSVAGMLAPQAFRH